MVPSSHPGSGSSSSAEIPNGGLSDPAANQFPVQPPEPSPRAATQFPYLAGSSSNSCQNAAPSGFPGPMVGSPLLPSSQVTVNLPQISQLASFGASPGQTAMFQNEQQNLMAGININNMASNTAPVEMTNNDNFSPVARMMVNGASTSSPLPDLQLGSPVALPAQMVNGGEDAPRISPVQDDQQPPDEVQPTYSIDAFLEDIFNSVVNHDFNPDAAALFGGKY